MEKDIEIAVTKFIEMMMKHARSLKPFLLTTYPYQVNLQDAYFQLILNQSFSFFLNQYSLRLKKPTPDDYKEFGEIILRYKDAIEKTLK